MWKKILLGLAVGLSLFLVFVAFQPNEYAFKREIAIQAAPDVIFPYLNNPKEMPAWNPYLKMDPAIKLGYEGPESGVGAASTWDGEKIGAGRSVITESVPGNLVRADLQFFRPFKGTQSVEYTLRPEGNQTVVSWGVRGEKNFFSKIVCVFMDMEKHMGESFEKGLADLKQLAEAKK